MSHRIVLVVPLFKERGYPRLHKLLGLFAAREVQCEVWAMAPWRGMRIQEQGFCVRSLVRFADSRSRRAPGDYLRWTAAVALQAVRAPSGGLYYALGLDCALPLALTSVMKQSRVIYDNNDNFALRYRMPRLLAGAVSVIEAWVARRSLLHIVPAPSRWLRGGPNLRIVRNVPSRSLVDQALELARTRGYQRPSRFTLYVNGWLTEGRGMGTLMAALQMVDVRELKVVIAGRIGCEAASELAGWPCVEYVGELGVVEALATYFRTHAAFTYYDPSVPINVLAEPTKWGDCVVTGTAFIANQEILGVADYLRIQGCFCTPYRDAGGLASLFRRLVEQPGLALAAGARLTEMATTKDWDTQMAAVLDEAWSDTP